MFLAEAISPFSSEADLWLFGLGNGIILASMYAALRLRVDLTEDGTRGSSAMTVLLVAAHVFIVFAIAMQTFLTIRGRRAPNVQAQIYPSRLCRVD